MLALMRFDLCQHVTEIPVDRGPEGAVDTIELEARHRDRHVLPICPRESST